MKKIAMILICMMSLFSFGACGGSDGSVMMLEDSTEASQESTAEPEKDITIALIMKTLTNPFFIEMEKGARQAEEEFGISLIVKTGAQETSIDQQIDIVDDLISQKVDAIVIAPGGSTELIPVLKKAQDAGIIVVNIDNQLDPDSSEKLGLKDVPFISVDNVEGGYLSAKYIADKLQKPTKAAVIEGIKTAKNSKDRKLGAMKAFQESENIITIVTDVANWKIDEAYTVAKRLFQSNPDIGAVFCANDMMALGTIQYLKESGRTDVLVAGFDALEAAKEAIREGSLEVTIDQQANLQGYHGVKCALDLINQVPVELTKIIDIKVITSETL